MRTCRLLFLAAALLLPMPAAATQNIPSAGNNGNQIIGVGGVAITQEGLLQVRRSVAPPAPRTKADPALTYISLAQAFAQLQQSVANKTALPKELRYLQGLTRIDNIFVYPAGTEGTGDLVIAGPSEPINDANPLQPVGKVSGRPVLHLDDVITILRTFNGDAQGHAPAAMFGCSIDMTPDAQKIADDIGRRFANASRAQTAAALKEALGPQTVRIMGVKEDSRVALAMVSADYRLKRICIGAEVLPLVGTGTGATLSSNRVWFEPRYEALAISDDGLSYHFAGPRLQVRAAAQQFDDKSPATPAATAFAKRFSEKMPDVAARIEAIADLQNITDLFLLAVLIKNDKLDQKAGLNLATLLSEGVGNYQPASLPVPRTAETLMTDTGTTLIQGGVLLPTRMLASVERATSKTPSPTRARPAKTWYLTKAAAAK